MHETKHVSPSISSFTQSNVILHRVSWMNNVPRSRSSRLENRTTLLILLLRPPKEHLRVTLQSPPRFFDFRNNDIFAIFLPKHFLSFLRQICFSLGGPAFRRGEVKTRRRCREGGGQSLRAVSREIYGERGNL